MSLANSVITQRAAIYCRVSSRGQADEGTSLDTQEAAARAYCAERGSPSLPPMPTFTPAQKCASGRN